MFSGILMISHFYANTCKSLAYLYLEDVVLVVHDTSPIYVGTSVAYPTVLSPLFFIVLLVFPTFQGNKC